MYRDYRAVVHCISSYIDGKLGSGDRSSRSGRELFDGGSFPLLHRLLAESGWCPGDDEKTAKGEREIDGRLVRRAGSIRIIRYSNVFSD